MRAAHARRPEFREEQAAGRDSGQVGRRMRREEAGQRPCLFLCRKALPATRIMLLSPPRRGSAQCRPESVDGRQSWVAFFSKSRPDQYPGPGAAGDGPRHDRFYRRAIQSHRRGMLCRPEAGVQDRADDPRLCRLRAWRVGSRARQPVLAGRQGAGGRDRLFLAELGHALRGVRARGRDPRQRLAPRRRPGSARNPAARGSRAPVEGGAGRAQRNLDRGRPRHRGIAPRDRRRRGIRHCSWST